MYNKVILIGRLTADPELKQTQSGTDVCSFRIAVNRAFDREKADFINVVAWRNGAQFVSKYFQKGSVIGVEGSLQMREYTDKNNERKVTAAVVGDRFFFTGGKQEGHNSEPARFPSPVSLEAPQAVPQGYEQLDGEDDLPF